MLDVLIVSPFAGCALIVGALALRGRLPAGTAAQVLLAIYLGWVFTAGLFPLQPGSSADRAHVVWPPATVNLMPLAVIRDTIDLGGWQAVRLLAGNVLVFVPFGLLAPEACPRLASWPRMLLAGAALSLSLEVAQLATSVALASGHRSTDIDDVLLNVPGVLLGFACWRVFRPQLTPLDDAGTFAEESSARTPD